MYHYFNLTIYIRLHLISASVAAASMWKGGIFFVFAHTPHIVSDGYEKVSQLAYENLALLLENAEDTCINTTATTQRVEKRKFRLWKSFFHLCHDIVYFLREKNCFLMLCTRFFFSFLHNLYTVNFLEVPLLPFFIFFYVFFMSIHFFLF